jgi:hypothetical protein
MKNSAKVLLYFGLDCGMLEFFTHKPESKKQVIFEHSSEEKITVGAHTNRDSSKQEVGLIFA